MDKKFITLIKDIIIFAIGTIGSKMVLFILVPLYTNCLSPDEYGVADLVFTLSQLLLPFLCLGIYHAVIRFGLDKNENADNILMCGIFIALIGMLFIVCLTPVIGLYSNLRQWRWYFCTYVILQMFYSIFQNYAKAIGKNKIYSIVSIIYTFVLALLNVWFLLYKNWGIRGYLMANVLATAAAVLILMIVCKIFTLNRRANFSVAILKKMLKYSMPLILDGAIWWIIQSSNKLFVENFLGSEQLGFYTVATKIPALMYIVVTIFSQAWGISAIREVDNENDNHFYNNIFSIYVNLTFFICICLVAIIKPFMSIYVNETYFSSWKYIPLLLAGNAFLSIADFFGVFYNALKKPVKNMLVSLVSAIVSVLISVLLMKYIGIWAAVISTFFAYFILMWVRLIDIKKYIHIKINWRLFLFNQLLLIVFSILIVLDFHISIISAVVIFLFLIANRKIILRIVKKLITMIRGIGNNGRNI